MRIATNLASLGMLAVLAGCSALSSINPFASKEAPRNPPAELVDFKPTMTVRTAWSTSIGSSGAFVFSPAGASNSIFAAAADGSIVRMEAATGRTLWRINAGVPLTAGVGSDGDTVAVVGEKGQVLAFDGAGKLRWKAQASSEVLSAPAVGQGLVIVRSLDNRIAAFDAESGARRWTVQRTVPPLTLRTAPGIVISGSAAFVAMPGGRLLALTLSNGGPIWEVAVGDPRGATELERVTDVSGAPVVLGRDVCAVAYQGRIGCVDALTGATRWAKEFSSVAGVAGDERFVFGADERSVVNAFTRDTGASVWSNNKLANRGLSAPASFGRAVAIGDAQGYVHFLSREDGSFIARTGTDGSRIIAAPLVFGPNLIFQTHAGTVTAFAAD
ncbi:MAG: outer membrane protein assembly factor BamB [Burkholderiales bacterium RIFCSPLOWO2_02_FULL_57_36]|nr:MAG: outer membrane protein assembly factor BamB [Burkholderiales bacterium RIFCSPLOWO2_02_FULL_57_36]